MSHYSTHGLMLTLVRRVRRLRRKLYNRLLGLKLKGVRKLNIDPSAQILGLDRMTIGHGFKAGLNLRLEALTRFQDQTFEPRIIIGDQVEVHDFVHIGAIHRIEIGSHVLMASKIYISDHNHGSYAGDVHSDPEMPPALRPLDATKSVVIEDRVWLGEFVTVLPGATIGRGSIIGANSVVTGAIPPHCIAVGAPARVVKRFNAETRRWEKA